MGWEYDENENRYWVDDARSSWEDDSEGEDFMDFSSEVEFDDVSCRRCEAVVCSECKGCLNCASGGNLDGFCEECIDEIRRLTHCADCGEFICDHRIEATYSENCGEFSDLDDGTIVCPTCFSRVTNNDSLTSVALNSTDSGLVRELSKVRAQKKILLDREAEIRAKLIESLGSETKGILDGTVAIRIVTKQSIVFDSKLFKKDHPTLSEEYLKTKETTYLYTY